MAGQELLRLAECSDLCATEGLSWHHDEMLVRSLIQLRVVAQPSRWAATLDLTINERGGAMEAFWTR